MADAILGGGGIYAIRNKVTGKVYVGSAGRFASRFSYHRSFLVRGRHTNQKLQRAWLKYGAEGFEFVILEVVDLTHLAEREQYWMDTLRAVAEGYNIRPMATNNRGLIASAETRAAMSAAHKGRKHSDEAKAKIAAANRGKNRFTPEQIARMSVERQGRRHTPEALEKIAATSRGRERSAESIAKGEAARRATIALQPIRHTDQARLNMSLGKRGLPAKNRKPVILFGQEYASIDAAARAHERSPAWVKARLKGIPCRPSTKDCSTPR